MNPISADQSGLEQQHEGIVFLSAPSYYSMAEEWYEFVTEDHFWIKWRFTVLKNIIPHDYQWGRILDIGCGNGVVGKQIQDSWGVKISGCDLNLAALRTIPSGRFSLYFYNIHERYQEFKHFFSTISLMDVLEHIADPVEFLKAVCFHLKSDGRLIINVPAIPLLYSRYDQASGHVKRYDFSTLKRELNLSGFEIERIQYWGISLVLVLLIRKFVLLFCDQQKIMETGFNPKSDLASRFLDSIRRIECRVLPRPMFGSSIMAVVKRKTSVEV